MRGDWAPKPGDHVRVLPGEYPHPADGAPGVVRELNARLGLWQVWLDFPRYDGGETLLGVYRRSEDLEPM